jgi:hypothetical protein
VVIQTRQQLIRGTIHVRPTERIIDELNHSQPFLAVTEAEILAVDGGVSYTCNFLTLNTSHIVWMIPVDEIQTHED